MPIDPVTLEFRPHRRDPDGRKCDGCRRVFAAGTVPAMDVHGHRICRECRMKPPEHTDRALFESPR